MDIEKQVLALQRELEKKFPMKNCPKCDAEVSMVLIETWPNKGDGETFEGYRCLKCDTVYKQILQPVQDLSRA